MHFGGSRHFPLFDPIPARQGCCLIETDRSARSGWKVAPSRALGPGITERASEGSGKARKACFRRKFDSSLRQRVPFLGITRPAADLDDRVVRPNFDAVVGIVRKAASWNRLVELYKRLPIDEFGDTRRTAAASPKTDGAPAGGGREEEDTRHDGAVSQDRRSSPGGLAEGEKTPSADAAAAGARVGRASEHYDGRLDDNPRDARALGERRPRGTGSSGDAGDRVVRPSEPGSLGRALHVSSSIPPGDGAARPRARYAVPRAVPDRLVPRAARL
ncbi:hypothetical protein THAOC_15861, partial [Thalassiosira oceanica]